MEVSLLRQPGARAAGVAFFSFRPFALRRDSIMRGERERAALAEALLGRKRRAVWLAVALRRRDSNPRPGG
jgi:hypothetical protein